MSHGTTVRIVIAEDERHVRDALVDIVDSDAALELVGTAVDAAAAIELCARAHPHVALVDVRMPVGGGPAAALGIRSASPTTVVIALSAYDDEGARAAMRDAGAVRYLVKGGRIEELLSAIRDAASPGDELTA